MLESAPVGRYVLMGQLLDSVKRGEFCEKSRGVNSEVFGKALIRSYSRYLKVRQAIR